ncbi:unnamed protein product [Paramecium primaurelia]|uniref:Macro domain-containing protein n=2 Tax=Paramecium TaxID=5884 RepID=A0A8S1WPE9_9CILI|nr:unnamed protein product [Paramecium primaurelia]CAD8190109.1 unnamed protein product [Paramecium pentaurelia]
MGNNLCYQTGERSSQFPQLLLKYEVGNCEIALTAGPVENEDVECLVIPTDQEYSNIKQSDKPTFAQLNGKCVFVAARKKQKNQILAVVIDKETVLNSDKSDDEKQTIYEAVQEALKIAEQKQMKSIGFPVFTSKDHTTSATIMLMAIKLSVTEQKIKSLKRIVITLDHIEQVSSFKWVFQQVFKGNQQVAHSRTYSSSIMEQMESIQADIIKPKQKSATKEEKV